MRLGSPKPEDARYYKFAWNSAQSVPPIGQMDYQPKGGAVRMLTSGSFVPTRTKLSFPEVKFRNKLSALGFCAYCGRTHDSNNEQIVLTSEHIIPEFLGAGLELPEASCPDCQAVTSKFENAIARDMFDPVRKHLAIPTKGSKEMRKGNFPVDVGREKTDNRIVPIADYPTIITLPIFFPAPTYSSARFGANGLNNFLIYNLNVNPEALASYGIDGFCTQSVDVVRFCQMLAKIAHVAVVAELGLDLFQPFLTDFIRTDMPKDARSAAHFDHVGCIREASGPSSSDLHEIEVGNITWEGAVMIGARVRLFAKYGFPSYHIAVGSLPPPGGLNPALEVALPQGQR